MAEKENIRIQDDLYAFVNSKTLEQLVIPDDRPTAGGFAALDEEVEKLMMSEFAAFAGGEKDPGIPEVRSAAELYKKVLDTDRRNREGITPVLPLLSKIRAVRTASELNACAADLALQGVPLPIDIGVETDMGDATKHSFIVKGPDTILPDTTYYEEGNEAGKQLLAVYADMADKALAFTDLSEDDRKTYIDDMLAFDALVAKKVKSQVEWSRYAEMHNPMSTDEVQGCVAPFDLKGLLSQIYGDKAPDTVVVYDPKAIKEMSGYFSESTLQLYIHWCYVRTLLAKSAVLSEDLAAIGKIFRRTMTGVAKDPVIEKQAYQTVSGIFSEPIGVYYGRTYFGEEAKKDIVSLVKKIIETYKHRVARNAFLEEKTKQKAIVKLDAIEIKMGYPDLINEYYSTLTVDPADSFYDAMEKLGACKRKHNFDELLKPVDRSKWQMPGHMVNACYDPSCNDITFPAAILQKPFYALSQSVSENLGGIGAVIGHEISHAFDNNGAQFDEKGNLSNWWTENDYEAFKTLTQEMTEQFDGIPFHGGKVNGELVVSENIADNGGMAVTIEIMHSLKDPDFAAYFMNWGRVWCRKAKEEFTRLLLSIDVHSPAELRANMMPRNFSEWYETFGVTAEDGMYLAPEKRIVIW